MHGKRQWQDDRQVARSGAEGDRPPGGASGRIVGSGGGNWTSTANRLNQSARLARDGNSLVGPF